jgi:hypothetical protein
MTKKNELILKDLQIKYESIYEYEDLSQAFHSYLKKGRFFFSFSRDKLRAMGVFISN